MTYFGFLFRFLFIPILVFLLITFWDERRGKAVPGFGGGRAVWAGIAIHVFLAVVYTTPWDNYLVATGVWSYNPELVTGLLIGYVPIEEYTFFIVETILCGLWWWFLARRVPVFSGTQSGMEFTPDRPLIRIAVLVVVSIWLVFSYLLFFGTDRWTYLSITLFWALPPIVLQLLFGADILWHHRRLVAPAILVPGTYLSAMDILALRETTWSISPAQTTGVLFFGILPLEEVVFFFMTSTLIAFGLTLLLSKLSEARLAQIRGRLQAWKQMWRPGQESR